jgi:hypothetical protein
LTEAAAPNIGAGEEQERVLRAMTGPGRDRRLTQAIATVLRSNSMIASRTIVVVGSGG